MSRMQTNGQRLLAIVRRLVSWRPLAFWRKQGPQWPTSVPVSLVLLIAALALPQSSLLSLRVEAQTVTPSPAPTYVVQPGDSWTSVSRKTGIPIGELQAANPRSVRPTGWLLVGEVLVLPIGGERDLSADESSTSVPATSVPATATTVTATPDPILALPTNEAGQRVYTVQPGESWNSIAQKFGISPETLRAANPRAVRPGLVLFRNEQLIIPAPVTPTPTLSPEVTRMPEKAEATETIEPEAEPTEAAASCPSAFADYPARIEELLAESSDMEAVTAFLSNCQALNTNNTRSSDWNDDGIADWALVLENPHSDSAQPEQELLILMSDDSGYALKYQARPAGRVSILAADDVNLDDQPDLVWVDTTCGASTCFDAVLVRSWDGSGWIDWTERTIVMAYAEVKLDEVSDTGQGREIVLQGGQYGSIGAGPQRERTEVWGSVDGAPYTLLGKTYAPSNCLYFKVLDANEALARYQELGLTKARALYTEAITNRMLVKCGQRSDELNELRSFSLFRLAVIHGYEGAPALAEETIEQLRSVFPDSPFTPLAESWLEAYEASGDAAAACAAATIYAEAHPETYQALSDYGYANPTFTATDLCPVLDVDQAPSTDEAAEGATGAIEASQPITPLFTLTATTDLSAVTAPVATEPAGELPDCPKTLDEYVTALPIVLTLAEGDPLIIETWLRLCDGMTDQRGGMLLADFNSDGIEDALFLPTIVSDLGFGPGGTQGAVLLYHGGSDGYTLAYAPEIYGQPSLLAADDLNGDGRIDLAWAVDGCSTFCVKEVQIVTWDRQRRQYIPIIEPGAIIAEGKAEFTEAAPGLPGQGLQLVLSGGVSGAPDGGLKIEHEEIWRSVDGRPFRRLSWTYDRTNANSHCMGLRLIEADIALNAADILGYGPAIDLYRAALDPSLKACSIHGIPAPEELKLLQGLAMFRLMQAQALSGDLEAAQESLAALQQGQGDSAYARAAAEWLEIYKVQKNPGLACQRLQRLFDTETLTWQITDHFGYNHPALAPEQICFVPRNR